MDHSTFDAHTCRLGDRLNRRTSLGLLISLGVLPPGAPEAVTAKKRKKKKVSLCHGGQTIMVSRKKKKRHLKHGDVLGACPTSPPPGPPPPGPPPPPCAPRACPANGCGSLPDGCGGTLRCGGCPANQICLIDGVCQPCTVTCTGTPTACGAALQQALDAGGTYYVCPGTYRGGFAPADAVTIIGAGEGDDPANNTILDGGAAGRVLTIPPGSAPVTLARLRIRDGRVITTGVTNIAGAGILHEGTMLRMTECTVSISYLLNQSQSAFASGAGVAVAPGSALEMTRCTVRDNHIIGTRGVGGGIWSFGTTTLTDCLVETNSVPSFGGGLHVDAGTTTLAGTTRVRANTAFSGGGIYVDEGTVEIAESCRVTQNIAPGNVGGISNVLGTVTLDGADPSPIVVNNCSENCGGPAGVPKCLTAPPVSCPP